MFRGRVVSGEWRAMHAAVPTARSSKQNLAGGITKHRIWKNYKRTIITGMGVLQRVQEETDFCCKECPTTKAEYSQQEMSHKDQNNNTVISSKNKFEQGRWFFGKG